MTEKGDNVKIYEAGFVQRREWMLYKIRGDHYPFNIHISFELDTFDPYLFQKVIDLIVEKHEILRTTLKVSDGGLKQIVHSSENFKIQYNFFDLTQKNEKEKLLFINDKKKVQFKLPFNFEFGPLFRVMIFAKNEKSFEVISVFHHVIFDNHSAKIFKKDAFHIWSLLNEDKSRHLYEENFQYRNYSSFENQLLATNLGDDYRKYWRNQLESPVYRLLIIDADKWDSYLKIHKGKISDVRRKVKQLPYHDERVIASVIRRYRAENAGTLKYIFKKATFVSICQVKNNINNNLLSLFIASLLKALQKLSGQEKFVFELPASRKMIGHFKNTIGWLVAGGICYFDLNGRDYIEDLLNYIDKQLYYLSRNCIYPVESIGYKQDIPIGSMIPVFLTLVELKDKQKKNENDEGIVSHIFEDSHCYQDLTIFIYLFGDSCNMEIVYNNFLISPNTAEVLSLEIEVILINILDQILGCKSYSK